MAKYVALLRGIGPSNPNMRQKKLCGVLEDLGFSGVAGVISSGNVLFEANSTDAEVLEAMIEPAWPRKLGFSSTTIIRSQEQLQQLAAIDPFKGLEHSSKSYLMATFFKKPLRMPFKLPHQPHGKPYRLIYADKLTLCTITDNTVLQTTDLMAWLEKQFGKEITSRTWLTVQRIITKMASS